MARTVYVTPEDEFNAIIDSIEFRAMASDGPVTPTLKEATEKELSRLWELVNEISPKRKALSRKMLKIEKTSDEEVNQYLINEGLDPDQVGREGSVFVKTVQSKLELQRDMKDVLLVMAESPLKDTEWFQKLKLKYPNP